MPPIPDPPAAPDFSGSIEPPAHLAIDADALDRYMRAHVADYRGPVSVRKFKGGQSNPTYLLTTPARRYVLRRKPPGVLLPSAHAVDREYKVMTALARTGFPVPQTFTLCDDDSVIGTMFFIMDFVEGRIFWDAGLPEAARSERTPLYHALIDTLADLHRIDFAAIGLSDFGKPGNYFARQIERWTKQYRAAETTTIDAMDRLIAWLPGAAPASEESSIVHGDFRFDNVIMDPATPAVRAVLDWELATLGHPLADFTYFLMSWHFPKDVRGGLAGRDLDAEGLPSMDDAVARYCARTGRSGVASLDFCLAYNMFRISAIIQGVYARALSGNASSSEAMNVGAQVAPLAGLAWRFAQKAGA